MYTFMLNAGTCSYVYDMMSSLKHISLQAKIIATVLCTCYLILCSSCDGDKDYTDGNGQFPGGDNNTASISCWFGGRNEPCSSLDEALERLTQNNDSAVLIEPGTYNLNSSSPVNYRFYHLSNISIIGASRFELRDNALDQELVILKCSGVAGNGRSVGFTFVHTSNILFQHIALIGCGVCHESTSKNFSSTERFEFLKFYTALYFLFCQNVSIENVHVNDTHGVGAVMYSAGGVNYIRNSIFSNNMVDPSSHLPGGGGLYIEFAYCVPDIINGGYVNCSSPTTPTIGAQYVIEASSFVGNQATLPPTMSNLDKFILPHQDQHIAFGRGGGLSVYFKGNSNSNVISVSNQCLFKDNKALWGGGIFVEHQDNSNNNSFNISDSNVLQNECYNKSSEVAGTGGGGVYLGYSFFTQTRNVHNNKMLFNNVNITQNQAYFGGGLSFYSAREQNQQRSTNTLEFVSCTWRENIARVGSAVDISPRTTNSTDGGLVQPIFQRCTFENNSAKNVSSISSMKMTGDFVGIGALYVDSVPVHFAESACFLNNSQTALASINAGLYFKEGCTANFDGNSGRKGGAIALYGNSFVQVSERSSMTFRNNHAKRKGGAIYGESIGEHDLISSRNCFIRYSDITKNSSSWNSNFYFEGNTVGDRNKSINSLYLTSLLTCVWVNAGQHLKLSSETISELAKQVFCPQNDSTNWKYLDSTDKNCTQEIATSSAYFYANISSISKPFHESYYMSVVPGNQSHIPILTADDRANDVTKEMVLMAKVMVNTGNVTLDNSSTYVHSNDSIIVYGEPNDTAVIEFETDSHRVLATTVNVTLKPCPPGLSISAYEQPKKCQCDNANLYDGYVNCSDAKFQASLKPGGWLGYVNNTQGLHAGQCPFGYCKSRKDWITLSTEEDLNKICESGREGTLCGNCQHSSAPAVSTDEYQCVKCSDQEEKYNWLKYLLIEYVPITVFFLVVVLFNVSVTTGPANAFVFFAQMITSIIKLEANRSTNPSLHFAKVLQTIYSIPYNIWNLSFFRSVLPPFCIGRNITMLQYISIDYVTAFYPFLLVTVFYVTVSLYARGIQPIVCLFQPLHRCFLKFRSIWNLERSILHSLATFLLLSYTKFTLVSFYLLKPAPLVNSSGQMSTASTVVYFDGSVKFLSKDHRPYIVVSVVVLVVFVLLPPIVLIAPSINHGLRKYVKRYHTDSNEHNIPSCHIGPSWEQFLNAFQGCYKDGTGQDGTSNKTDLRWFSGAYFLLRLISFAIFAFATDWYLQMMMQQILYTISMLGFAVLRPYKKDIYNKIDTAVFANLAVINALLMYNYQYVTTSSSDVIAVTVIQFILIICPLVFMTWYIFKYLLKKYARKISPYIRNVWPMKHCFRTGENVEVEEENTEDFLRLAGESGRLDGVLEYSIDIDEARRRQSPLDSECEPLLEHDPSDKTQNRSTV